MTAVLLLAVLAVAVLRRRVKVPAQLAARARRAGLALAAVAVLAAAPAAVPALVPVLAALAVVVVLTAAGTLALVWLMSRAVVPPGGIRPALPRPDEGWLA